MSARRQFVAECGRAAAAFMLMACQRSAIAPAACAEDPPGLPDPAPDVDRRDVYVVDGFTGLQLGTKANPYSVRGAAEFDALLAFLLNQDNLAVHFAGSFATRGVYRWGQFAGRNLGKNWTVDGGAEITIDPNSVTDVRSVAALRSRWPRETRSRHHRDREPFRARGQVAIGKDAAHGRHSSRG